MALTNAERQRRYRDRKRAEQEKQAESAAEFVTDAVTGLGVTPELGSRGRRLWNQVAGDGSQLDPSEQVLLEEACRLVDRLDVLDRILRGDDEAWMRLHARNEDGSVVQVVLNNALAEARQQQVALKQLLAELRQSRAGANAGGRRPAPVPGAARRVGAGAATGAGTKGGGGVVADLAAWVADRAGGTPATG